MTMGAFARSLLPRGWRVGEHEFGKGDVPGLHLEKEPMKQIAHALGVIAMEMQTLGPRLDRVVVHNGDIARQLERLVYLIETQPPGPSPETLKILLDIQAKVTALQGGGSHQAEIDRITAQLKAANDALAAARGQAG